MSNPEKVKAPKITAELHRCLERAYDLALASKHAYVAETHLVAELITTSEAEQFLAACDLDISLIRDMVMGSVAEEKKRPWYRRHPKTHERVREIMRIAAFQAISAELEEVSPLMVLVQILDADERSVMIERLDALELDVLALKRYIANGTPHERLPEKPHTRQCEVVFHNDSYTTMEFVVYVLMKHFELDEKEATAKMMTIHQNGSSTFGPLDSTDAMGKVEAIRSASRKRGFPLRLTLNALR